jgi:hypothetical protein
MLRWLIRRMAEAFELNALLELLTDGVRFVADGGGKAAAARHVIEGADRTAHLIIAAATAGASRGPC